MNPDDNFAPDPTGSAVRAQRWNHGIDLEHFERDRARPLLRLDATLSADLAQAPRPFLHPMRTLGGLLASDFAPPDHAWHHGLSMTCAALHRGEDTFNFWGGPTFERERGYVHRANHGRQRSTFATIETEAGHHSALIQQSVCWTVGEETLIEEERVLQVLVLPQERAWRLSWSSLLTNVCGHSLRWGSPTTEGRPNAGYGGLFWRGPRALEAAHVALADREAPASTCEWLGRDEDVMGRPMRAGEDLIFRARSAEGSFLLACEAMQSSDAYALDTEPDEDQSQDLGWQPRWFARTSVPMVAWAFSFDAERTQQAGQTWSLDHRLALLDMSPGEEFEAARLRQIWDAV